MEESICLDLLCKNNSNPDWDFIRKVRIKDLLPIANVLECDVSKLLTHWNQKLKAQLLRHLKNPNADSPFASFLISKEVKFPQEIDWDEINRIFVNSKRSLDFLKQKLNRAIEYYDRLNPDDLCIPLFKKLKNQRYYQIPYAFDRIRKVQY